MKRCTVKSALTLQDLFVTQWDNGANLKPSEERIRNTSNESQKVCSICPWLVSRIRAFSKTAVSDASRGEMPSYYVKIGLEMKVLEENSLFSWRATDDNEDVFFPALQTAASLPLALLTKINSCFHLSQCIFTPLQVCSAALASKAEENLE